MAKTIRIHDVPDRVHRQLNQRAATAGMTLSAYLPFELEKIATMPSARQVRRRLADLSPVVLDESVANAVRAIRGD